MVRPETCESAVDELAALERELREDGNVRRVFVVVEREDACFDMAVCGPTCMVSHTIGLMDLAKLAWIEKSRESA
jgi:NAD-dependent dihydropyrimidine dehydrogenase PreA subunit